MKTLSKIIKRLLLGASLEDYEARQKAETARALKRLHTAYPVSKITQATPRLWSGDRVRATELSKILQMQIEAQLQIIEQTKRAAHGR